MVQKTKLEQFYDASLELLEATTLQSAYKIIVNRAMKLIDAKYASIFEFSSHGFNRVYTSDPRLMSVIPRKDGDTYKTYKTKGPFMRHRNETKNVHPELIKFGIGSDITVPLTYEKRKYGVLSVMSGKNKRFTGSDLEIMKYFAPLASFSIRQQKLQDKVKAALNQRDLFITMAAHEIKTPLALILANTELIRRYESKGKLPKERIINKIEYAAKRLKSLVKEFWSTQQIKSGSDIYDFERTNFNSLVGETINYFYAHYPSHKVIFTDNDTSKSLFINADSEKLKQAILNIFRNAGKFSSSKKPILATIHKSGKVIILTITDKGAGIPKEDIGHVFEKYYRGSHSKQMGMGLGLFLSKSIINSHHGLIKVTSTEGVGTTVSVQLPKFELF